MSKWLIFAFAICIISSVVGVFFFGLKPKAYPILKPSYFEHLEAAGRTSVLPLWQEVEKNQILFIGLPDKNRSWDEFFVGFFKSLAKDQVSIDRVFVQDSLSFEILKDPFFTKFKIVDFHNVEDLVEKLSPLSTERVLVFSYAENSFHRGVNNWSNQIESHLKRAVLSISLTGWPVLKEERSQFNCVESDAYHINLDCASLALAMRSYRNKYPQKKWLVALDQHGVNDFVVYIHPPLQ
jgi:hypothetical protein